MSAGYPPSFSQFTVGVGSLASWCKRVLKSVSLVACAFTRFVGERKEQQKPNMAVQERPEEKIQEPSEAGKRIIQEAREAPQKMQVLDGISKECHSPKGKKQSRPSQGRPTFFSLPLKTVGFALVWVTRVQMVESSSLEPFPWDYQQERVCTTGLPKAPQFILDCSVLPWQRSRVGLPNTTATAAAPMAARQPSRAVQTAEQLVTEVWSCFSKVVSVCRLLFQAICLFFVKWAYPFTEKANDANPLQLLGWLVALGILGLAWDHFCEKEVSRTTVLAKRRQALLRSRQKRHRKKHAARMRKELYKIKHWRPFPSGAIGLKARKCAGRRYRAVRGSHFLRPVFRRGPRQVWAIPLQRQGRYVRSAPGWDAKTSYISWLSAVSDELKGGVASDAGPPTCLAEALTSVLQQWEFQDHPQPQTQKATTYRSDTCKSQDGALAKHLIAMLKVCLNKQESDQEIARKIRVELKSVAAEPPPQRVVKINDLPAKAPVDPTYGDHWEEWEDSGWQS